MFLFKRHAAGRNTCALLHGQFAIQLTAPLGLQEAALGGDDLLGLSHGGDVEGVLLTVLQSHGVHIVVDGIQQLLDGDVAVVFVLVIDDVIQKHRLDRIQILNGDLDEVIDSLVTVDQAEKLKRSEEN
mgnify:CR=1 FL=1